MIPIDAINHMMSFLTAVVTSREDKLLMLLEQQGNTHLEQEEAIQGNNGLSFVTIAKGRVILPSSVLSLRGKGMKHGLMRKCTDRDELNLARSLSWRISPGMAQSNSLRYKEEVKDLKEMQNVENSFSGSNEQYAEIVRLKETLFEQVQEKDSLMKTVSDLKNDLKMKEN
ncbi:hypothetical protein Tco_0067037 [Tanacetum coccineum]